MGLLTSVSAESVLKPFNDLGYGTISGRIQSLSMYRDYADNGLGNGANSSLGIVLGYTTPEFAGFDGGLAYNYAGEWFENNNTPLLANDSIHILNEAWVRYNFQALSALTNTTLLAGRKINNAEIFRSNDFRQKARSIETVQLDSSYLNKSQITLGHAFRMSNWIQVGDRWEFNNFGDVFGVNYDSDGVTWGEALFQQIEGLEVALFDAYAWDVSNLTGVRAKWSMAEKTALLGYYRHEMSVGKAADQGSHAFGFSLQQTWGAVTLEPGFFSVHGANLRFQELTTGINHALGNLMMVYSQPFNGGADTAYFKAKAKIKKTAFTALYCYTWQDDSPFDGQELNLILSQQITENFSVALKGGLGYRQMDSASNATATDARLFLTYRF